MSRRDLGLLSTVVGGRQVPGDNRAGQQAWDLRQVPVEIHWSQVGSLPHIGARPRRIGTVKQHQRVFRQSLFVRPRVDQQNLLHRQVVRNLNVQWHKGVRSYQDVIVRLTQFDRRRLIGLRRHVSAMDISSDSRPVQQFQMILSVCGDRPLLRARAVQRCVTSVAGQRHGNAPVCPVSSRHASQASRSGRVLRP